MNRYARQMQLHEIGASGQTRLGSAHALVVGAGGLAATVLPQLVGAGLGRITLVDGDDVDLHNLHRQTLFAEEDCGRPKALAAAARLRALNADVAIQAVPAALTPATAPALAQTADLVLDCADSHAVSYMLSDTCLAADTPLFSASVLQFSGYALGVCGGAPSLRAVFPDAPDTAANCTTAGVSGPSVAVVAAAQAQMAMSHLLGLSPDPLGQCVQFDLRNFRFSGFRFDSAEEPAQSFPFLARDQIRASDTIVELRDAGEAPEMLHPDARRIAPDRLRAELAPADGRLVLCCATGLRAWRAAEVITPHWPGAIALAAATAS
ncbi:MAG: ThiF family adenylyltransferase [Pseudomonadota bacterium]